MTDDELEQRLESCEREIRESQSSQQRMRLLEPQECIRFLQPPDIPQEIWEALAQAERDSDLATGAASEIWAAFVNKKAKAMKG